MRTFDMMQSSVGKHHGKECPGYPRHRQRKLKK